MVTGPAASGLRRRPGRLSAARQFDGGPPGRRSGAAYGYSREDFAIGLRQGRQIVTPSATIGIRGTGCYIEASPERVTSASATERQKSCRAPRHTRYGNLFHPASRPSLYILPDGRRSMVPAGVSNHSDAELIELHPLVGFDSRIQGLVPPIDAGSGRGLSAGATRSARSSCPGHEIDAAIQRRIQSMSFPHFCRQKRQPCWGNDRLCPAGAPWPPLAANLSGDDIAPVEALVLR